MSYRRRRPIAAAAAAALAAVAAVLASKVAVAAAAGAESSAGAFPTAEEIEGEHPLKIAAMAPKYISLNSLERIDSKTNVATREDPGFDAFMDGVCIAWLLSYCLFCTPLFFFALPWCTPLISWTCWCCGNVWPGPGLNAIGK